MNKSLKFLLPAACAAAAAASAVFLIAPCPAADSLKTPFMGLRIAHRGLHRRDGTVPENSLSAFRDAAERGYGIELDVHLTADGQLAVIHDGDTRRMCGVPGRIADMTAAQLRTLRLAGTDEVIPTLEEALDAIGGRVPVVIELKRGRRRALLCEKVLERLRGYEGAACIESFDPIILLWWKKHAPDILRGQLSCPVRGFRDGTNRLGAFALSRLMTNFLSRPHFIAYGVCRRKPIAVRVCERLGAMSFVWTSRSPVEEGSSDAVIFEFYRPSPHRKQGRTVGYFTRNLGRP